VKRRMMSTCSKCGQGHDRPQRYCLDCHAAYMRDWRKTHPMNEEAKRRDNARSHAGVYKRRGRLTPMPCQACGAATAEMHHPDHELPRDVIWLCRPCHLEWHAHCRETIRETFKRWLAPFVQKRRAA
jgi:hypothetical protein